MMIMIMRHHLKEKKIIKENNLLPLKNKNKGRFIFNFFNRIYEN